MGVVLSLFTALTLDNCFFLARAFESTGEIIKVARQAALQWSVQHDSRSGRVGW